MDKNEIIERPYKLRKFNDGDLLPLLSILRNIGLTNFKDTIVKFANGGSAVSVGIDVALNMSETIISRLEDGAGEEIYKFYSGICGLSVDEMKQLEFGSLPLMIIDSFAEVRNTSFFRVLSKLL